MALMAGRVPMLSLSQVDRLVLGADLNCSESGDAAAPCASNEGWNPGHDDPHRPFLATRGYRQPDTRRAKAGISNRTAKPPPSRAGSRHRPRRFIGGRPRLRRHGKGDHPAACRSWWHQRCRCERHQGPRGPLDRVAQMADRKYCRPHARPFRLGFPRKVSVFPICPPAAV